MGQILSRQIPIPKAQPIPMKKTLRTFVAVEISGPIRAGPAS